MYLQDESRMQGLVLLLSLPRLMAADLDETSRRGTRLPRPHRPGRA